MDTFAAQALTIAIQRYGQNERTLFSFLEMQGSNSVRKHEDIENKTYSLSNVYDYIIYHFHSFLSEANVDSGNWSAMRVALEKVEGLFAISEIPKASSIIKTIGLLNLFGSAAIKIDKASLCTYARYALNISNSEHIIELLEKRKIIRYAIYKSQYVIFEGTDINIEDELLKAACIVPKNYDFVNKLKLLFNLPIEFANSSYYRKGTPRYFKYIISDTPCVITPTNEIDGYINVIFNDNSTTNDIINVSRNCNEAILFAYFTNSDIIRDQIWEIDKLEHIQTVIDDKDIVAHKEIKSLLSYQKDQLNTSVLASLFNYNSSILWIYNGQTISVNNKAKFNKLLSEISDSIYYKAPTLINEMINKHKPSSAMSLARVKYLEKLLEMPGQDELGFDKKKFPPEKTIYKTILQKTEIHSKDSSGIYDLHSPKEESFALLWDACEDFMKSTFDKSKKLSELLKILKTKPFKLKQGFIDIWIPTYLIIKKNDFSLYDSKGAYIPIINREVLDILHKSPNDFSIKAFNIEGVKLDLFNKYRQLIGASQNTEFSTESLIETIRPFLVFYNKLDVYAQRTKRLNKKTSLKFRDVLAKAKDPEKTFFEDLPKALDFDTEELMNNEDILKTYTEIIQASIKDLRSCYNGLIDRIEREIIDSLGLKHDDFSKYHIELINLYSSIKTSLLSSKQKSFLNRIISPSTDRKSWFESICYIIIDKKLEEILDEEEQYLMDNLIFTFKELLKYADLGKIDLSNNENYYRLELMSKEGEIEPQLIKLNSEDETKVALLEMKIKQILPGESDIEKFALLNTLKKMIKDG